MRTYLLGLALLTATWFSDAALAQRAIEDGPSPNSMDMIFNRAGVPRQNLTTRIQALDTTARTLTADNGDVFVFANNLTPAPTLRAGQAVMLQFEESNGRKILHGITPLGN